MDVIFFVNAAVGRNSAGQYDLARAVKEEIGVPNVMIEGNMLIRGGIQNRKTRR